MPASSLLAHPKKSVRSPDPSEGSADTATSSYRNRMEKRPVSISSRSRSSDSLPAAPSKAPTESKSVTKYRKVFSSSSGSVQPVYEVLPQPNEVPDLEEEEERLHQMDLERQRAQRAIDVVDMTEMWIRLDSTPSASDSLVLLDTLSPGLLQLLQRGRVFAQLVEELGANRATKKARVLVRNRKKSFQAGDQDFEQARQRYNTAVMLAKKSRPPPTVSAPPKKPRRSML